MRGTKQREDFVRTANWQRWLAVGASVAAITVGGWLGTPLKATAQDDAKAVGNAATPADGAAEKPDGAAKRAGKERGKSRGRLPAYFAEVVNAEQKEKIYAIQEQYAAQLKKLQDEMVALQQKREAEIEGILTAEQKAKVADLASKARTSRKPEKPESSGESQ